MSLRIPAPAKHIASRGDACTEECDDSVDYGDDDDGDGDDDDADENDFTCDVPRKTRTRIWVDW